MALGTIKFFNTEKGFGFITPDDGGSDVFIHISAVQAAGLEAVTKGDQIAFVLDQNPRSGRISATDIRLMHKEAPPPSPKPPLFVERSTSHYSGSGEGVVRWFNPAKGFGFIQPKTGQVDVFVHVRDVTRAGFPDLKDGQAVAYDLRTDARTGKTSASNLRLL
ncbi:cold-shock protein [Brevundimonas faecalis]|uniref:CspA family cold shock protein n=1 Tax=Brevundimonas faecalis TaxID=947378 RepID=A0ABV2R8G4_9CAUL